MRLKDYLYEEKAARVPRALAQGLHRQMYLAPCGLENHS